MTSFRCCAHGDAIASNGYGYSLAPVPGWRRKGNENLPLGVRGDIFQIKDTLPLGGTRLAKRKKARQTAIGLAILGEAQQAQAILQIEMRADDELEAQLLGSHMRAHDARKCIAIRDGDGGQPQGLGLRDQFLRVGRPAQERKIRRHIEGGVTHRDTQS